MARKNYYRILGVEKDADQATIKRAYRRLAKQYHPDQNPGDTEAISKMKEINEAYDVLGDSDKRKRYDVYGDVEHEAMTTRTTEDIFRGMDFGSIFREFGLGDIFGESIFDTLFGHSGRAGAEASQRGVDRVYELRVTPAEAFSGTEKQIEVHRMVECSACGGSGARYAGLVECEQCLGSGQIVREQRTGFGLLRRVMTCSVCGGSGKLVIDPCNHCQGRGVVEGVKRFTVTVPAGVTSGDAIKVPDEGDVGSSGAAPGDLYVVLRVG